MQLIVLLHGRLPIRFVHNHCGKHWNACIESEATRFNTEDEAFAAIVDFHFSGHPFELKEVPRVEALPRSLFSGFNPMEAR